MKGFRYAFKRNILNSRCFIQVNHGPLQELNFGVLRRKPYEFTVKYRASLQNVAVALSRLTQHPLVEYGNVAEEKIRDVEQNAAAPRAISVGEPSAEDEEISRLQKCVNTNDGTL